MTSERGNYEVTVAAFTGLMLTKLRENDHKTHWRDEDIDDLFKLLKGEVEELEVEMNKGEKYSPVKISRECADIANFALMIADLAGGLDEGGVEREVVTIDTLQREIVRLREQVKHENTRWKEAFKAHLDERTLRQKLEASVLA